MNKTIPICPNTMQALRNVDVCLMSYNIEMTEITGGTFWKAYCPNKLPGQNPLDRSRILMKWHGYCKFMIR